MIFTKDKNTYFADVNKDLKIEIGDSKQETAFYPQLKILAFDNEINFSIRLKTVETGTDSKDAAEKITWSGAKTGAEFYDVAADPGHPAGAIEFNIILKEKPASRFIEFTTEKKDVELFYQGPLTDLIGVDGIVTATETEGKDKDGNIFIRRPENVVYSYAIYHRRPPANVVGGKEYRAGKIGHIYRPLITDSTGKKTYGILINDDVNNMLKIEIPEDFYNSAIYPVTVDPTFGYTTIGGTEVYFNAPGSLCHIGAGLIFSPTSGYNRVTKFTCYGRGDHNEFSLYSISGGLPVSRLAAGVECDLPAANAWKDTDPINQTLTNGITYGLAEGHANAVYVFFDTGAGNQRSACATDLPATWSSTGTTAALYSWYTTYETVNEQIL